MSKQQKALTLANGLVIPAIGFGTWQIPGGTIATEIVTAAFSAGYRLLDTAAVYGNEPGIGAAILQAPFPRDEVFLSGKLWNTKRGYESTLRACRQSLKRLKQEYFDLYLIHWPASIQRFSDWESINADTWRAMEQLLADGFAKAIGVCNFDSFLLKTLAKTAHIQPMLNQIELHPGFNAEDTVAYCDSHGMIIEAWSPLGSGALLDHPTVLALAKRYAKTPAQICIRWCAQKGAIPLPKTANPSRMSENIDAFSFELAEEDMHILDGLPALAPSFTNPDDDEMK